MTSFTRSRTLMALPATVAVLVLLAACSDDAAQTAPEVSASSAPSQDQGPTDDAPGGGGVSGEIAAVSDTLMQVQGDDGQTAVTWTGSTTITQTVAGTVADLATGVCVVAFTGTDGSTDSSSDDAAAAAATSVVISAATDGACDATGFGGATGGMPGGGMPGSGDDAGERPEGAPTDMPSGGTGGERPDGAPTDMPSGMPTGSAGGGMGAGMGAVTAGLVTAVSGTTVTVQSTGQDGSETQTFEVSDATTYTTDAAADSSAIVVGRCVTARGESDDAGQVTATTLTLSDAGTDGCSTGAGFGGGSRPQGDGDQGAQDGESADA